MRIHLRQRKQQKQSRVSLYLEIYKGTTRTPEGKVKGVRDYEYLDLYLAKSTCFVYYCCYYSTFRAKKSTYLAMKNDVLLHFLVKKVNKEAEAVSA
jgi:predicted nucleotide-binding protein (sugar kinase/HSP70/actin superfamily)